MTQVLRVGTRGSALALAQSGTVAALLADAAGGTAELIRIRTQGDVNLGPLASIGGTGVFVTEVRSRLLAGDVDVIVHSLKDLPTAQASGIALAAVPVREDPADALCARDGLTLDSLPRGSTVGTGSPRRAAQLLRTRPDLDVRPIRGNIDTRLSLVGSGSLDAVVLAAAGLGRLDRLEAMSQRLGPDLMLPAPAQGALAVECRVAQAQQSWYSAALDLLEDDATRCAVNAERSLLSALEAGCTAPVGAFATVSGSELTLTGAVIATDGTREIRGTITGPAAEATRLGADLAAQLIGDGAATLLSVRVGRAEVSPLAGWRVLVPRPQGRGSSLVTLLAREGAVAQAVPMIGIHPPVDVGTLDSAVIGLSAGEYSWVGFASVNALLAVLDRAAHLALAPAIPADTRVAAVGPATAAALRAAGFPVDLVPEHGGSAAALTAIWPAAHAGESVLLPQSEIAGGTLAEGLEAKGFRVDTVTAYRTLPEPLPSTVTADLTAGAYEAVLLTSPSTVRTVTSAPVHPDIALGAIGRSTATAITAAGLAVAYTAADPTDSALIAGLAAFATRHPRRRQT